MWFKWLLSANKLVLEYEQETYFDDFRLHEWREILTCISSVKRSEFYELCHIQVVMSPKGLFLMLLYPIDFRDRRWFLGEKKLKESFVEGRGSEPRPI